MMIVDDMSIDFNFACNNFRNKKRVGHFFRDNMKSKKNDKMDKTQVVGVKKYTYMYIHILHIFLIKFLHRSLQKKDPKLDKHVFQLGGEKLHSPLGAKGKLGGRSDRLGENSSWKPEPFCGRMVCYSEWFLKIPHTNNEEFGFDDIYI